MLRRKTDNILFGVLLAVFLGVFGYLLAGIPIALEDWEFLFFIREIGLWDSIVLRFNIDNVRIGNNLSIILLTLPRFVAVVIELAGLLLGIYVMLRMTKIKWGQWKKLSLFLFLLIFGVMWENNRFTQPYAFNYIVPIALLFVTVRLYIRPSSYPIWLQCLAGFALAAWHETFGLVFIAGAGMIWLLRREHPSRSQWAILIAAIMGAALMFTNPGGWNRAQEYLQINIFRLFIFLGIWVYILYLGLWIYAFRSPSFKRLALSPYMIFPLSGFVTFIFIFLFNNTRAAVPVVYLAVSTLTILLTALLKGRSKLLKLTVASTLYAIIAIHLGVVLVESIGVYRDYRALIKSIAEADPDKQKYTFAPTRYSWQVPLSAIQRPVSGLIEPGNLTIDYINLYYHFPDYVAVLPEDLKEYADSAGEVISESGHVRLWRGHIISSDTSDIHPYAANTKYRLYPAPQWAPYKRYKFIGADGRDYIYIYPKRSLLSRYAGPPESIYLIPNEN